ncbi:hypothetical protein AVEN_182699-1 [Araneus ventricosus]|uniref:Uncharacterized protein n=1 Tax=Araneus ventricosus TaxID=182803 RepID=A0A4Y2JTF9_ARAVE|nr:hypothetical protein AVEN_182699-1 [Araneus ventricosus]
MKLFSIVSQLLCSGDNLWKNGMELLFKAKYSLESRIARIFLRSTSSILNKSCTSKAPASVNDFIFISRCSPLGYNNGSGFSSSPAPMIGRIPVKGAAHGPLGTILHRSQGRYFSSRQPFLQKYLDA